jgi:hypothetical protein
LNLVCRGLKNLLPYQPRLVSAGSSAQNQEFLTTVDDFSCMSYSSKLRLRFSSIGRALPFSLLLAGAGARAEPSDQDLAALSLEELMKVTVVSASRHVEDVKVAPSAGVGLVQPAILQDGRTFRFKITHRVVLPRTGRGPNG